MKSRNIQKQLRPDHLNNLQNVTTLSSYFGNNEQSKGVSDLVSGKLKETKMVVQNQVQLKQNHTLSEARKQINQHSNETIEFL